MLLKYIYIVFIGILLAIFVGVGIAAFYPSPKSPYYNYPSTPIPIDLKQEASQAAVIKIQNESINRQQKDYRREVEVYNKNVSIIAISASILILIASLTLLKQILLIADGLLLGGVLTLLYSIARSFGSQDFKHIFAVVSVGLIIALVLGYLKFIKPTQKTRRVDPK